MRRVRVNPGYVRAVRKLDRGVAKRANAALVKFQADPNRPGLNFEPVTGAPGYFTIRVNRNFRILLRRERDAAGELYAAVDVARHDEAYRRR